MNKKLKNIFLSALFLVSINSIFAKEYSQAEAEKIRAAVVAQVKTYIGCPYETGGIGPNTFDCSGLIYTTFREAAGIQLPRSAKAIYAYVTIVPYEEMEEGDLVFFKTTGDGTISHVGIYIGRNQFIHAASDGSNTGVIVSSLTEKYYKNCYAAVGKPVTSAKKKLSQNNNQSQKNSQNSQPSKQESLSHVSQSSSQASNASFGSLVELDANLYCEWNLWEVNGFKANFRGINTNLNARYTGWKIQPGIGGGLRWNHGCQVFQFPFFISLQFNEYVGFYAGPVINCSNITIPGSKDTLEVSPLAGIISLSFNTPTIPIGNVELRFVQEFLYTIFGRADEKAIDFGTALNTGLTFSTGVRVTLPMKNVLK